MSESLAIGQLGKVEREHTAEQLTQFCENLKQSLLDALARGNDIFIDRKTDMEPVCGASHIPVDYTFEGCKFTVAIGRPAERLRLKRLRKEGL